MTHSYVDRDDLFAEVRRLIQDKFPDGLITEVRVQESLDEAGDRILLITAVFEGSTQDFVELKPKGLIRMLRNRLVEAENFAFPMLSFVSAKEAHA